MQNKPLFELMPHFRAEEETIKLMLDKVFDLDMLEAGPQPFEAAISALWKQYASQIAIQLTEYRRSEDITAKEISNAFAILFAYYTPPSFDQPAWFIIDLWDLLDSHSSEQKAIYPAFQQAYQNKLPQSISGNKSERVLVYLDEKTSACLEAVNEKIHSKADRFFPSRSFYVDNQAHMLLVELKTILDARKNTPLETRDEVLETYQKCYVKGRAELQTIPDRRLNRFFKIIESIFATLVTGLIGGIFLVPLIMKTKAEREAEKLDKHLFVGRTA